VKVLITREIRCLRIRWAGVVFLRIRNQLGVLFLVRRMMERGVF
jgi:hypothetical protein